MKRTSLVLTALLSLSGIAAHAESPDPSGQFAAAIRSGKTHAQVRAELQDAQRTGDILAAGEGGTAYERNPHAFPPRTMVAGKTREQVRAETLEAIEAGDIASGELGLTAREAFPQRYMARGGSVRGHRTASASQPAAQH